MKVKVLLLAFLAMCIGNNIQAQTTPSGKKILIVYYSWSENGITRNVANQIKMATGADIFEITPVTPYTTDYKECVAQARKEIEANFKPEIKGNVDNFKSYDIILVGSPNWCNTIAPPVATFLSKNDFSGKTILPFITYGGSGLGKSIEDIKALSPKATVSEALSVKASDVNNAGSDIQKWLKNNNVIKK